MTLLLESIPPTSGGPPCDTIIVGAGHAGLDLHLKCVRKAANIASNKGLFSGRAVIVEQSAAVRSSISGGEECVATLADVRMDPSRAVVHCAVGPAQQKRVMTECARLGYRNLILEKPLALHMSDVEEMQHLTVIEGLQPIVNLPLLSTQLMQDLRREIQQGDHGFPTLLYSVQRKSRAVRAGDVHPTAFEVETPHQVSMALDLFGGSARVGHANSWPLSTNGGAVPAFGGTTLWLRHQGGTANSVLHTDLDAHVRERKLNLVFEDGWEAQGWFPADGTNSRQSLTWFNSHGVQQQPSFYDDEPLVSLLTQAYRYFGGGGPEPPGTLQLAVATAKIISKAKQFCNLELGGD